jgi:predicted nucleotidyltransferase
MGSIHGIGDKRRAVLGLTAKPGASSFNIFGSLQRGNG